MLVSRAYNDISSITLVTARSVGISTSRPACGSGGGPAHYSHRRPGLEQSRGRKVYTSNLQLGSTQIMSKNGVSHLAASSDLQGVTQILEWLSYVPESQKRVPRHRSQTTSVRLRFIEGEDGRKFLRMGTKTSPNGSADSSIRILADGLKPSSWAGPSRSEVFRRVSSPYCTRTWESCIV